MRHITIVLSIIFALFSSPASGAQFILAGNGGAKISEDVRIGVFANVFHIPETTTMGFAYAGPGFTPTKWWWTSPRVGMVYNWAGDKDTLPILSWWNMASLKDGTFTIFSETEVYIGDSVDFYGQYMAGWNHLDLSIGAMAEQINADFTFGPYVGLSVGRFDLRTQYHWDGTQPGDIRLVVVTNLD
jgi:hypothetical protein